MSAHTTEISLAARAHAIRQQLPASGLFADQDWRISPRPFSLGPQLLDDLRFLGRILLQFNKAVNLLYRQSAAGKFAPWVAERLDQGKPPSLIDLQRDPAFKNHLPRVIRPDLLLTDEGLAVTELDSVPGGIGLTAWLNRVYSQLNEPATSALSPAPEPPHAPANQGWNPASTSEIVGGADGMARGFAGIFHDAPAVHIVVSEESAAYKPEMQWLSQELDPSRFAVRAPSFTEFADGDAVYRFFELFDIPNVASAPLLFDLARQKRIQLTPPPKPLFEEKMLFALLWNRNLRDFWRKELGDGFLQRLLKIVPYTWLVDPQPLPPHAAIPELNITDWRQLKSFSQKERELILKVSGFSESAWGSRGVHLGSDLSQGDWSQAIDRALDSFPASPYVLQRFHKPKTIPFYWHDFSQDKLVPMAGRVRLSPYYFVTGDGDAARAELCGALATICPADKKIIHGMKDAILVPCCL